MTYEVWKCDLNALYNGNDIAVGVDEFVEDVETISDAKRAIHDLQDHRTAAWVVNKETREIVRI